MIHARSNHLGPVRTVRKFVIVGSFLQRSSLQIGSDHLRSANIYIYIYI